MTKVKTSELIDSALDWAVANAEGRRVEFNHQYTEEIKFDGWWQLGPNHWQPLNNYSTKWAQGGPIIERYVTKAFRNVGGTWSAIIIRDIPIPEEERGTSLALTHRVQWNAAGPTPLIAAMRCFVASKIGDEVEVPDQII